MKNDLTFNCITLMTIYSSLASKDALLNFLRIPCSYESDNNFQQIASSNGDITFNATFSAY